MKEKTINCLSLCTHPLVHTHTHTHTFAHNGKDQRAPTHIKDMPYLHIYTHRGICMCRGRGALALALEARREVAVVDLTLFSTLALSSAQKCHGLWFGFKDFLCSHCLNWGVGGSGWNREAWWRGGVMGLVGAWMLQLALNTISWHTKDFRCGTRHTAASRATTRTCRIPPTPGGELFLFVRRFCFAPSKRVEQARATPRAAMPRGIN